jgi:uncharacterized ferritin-like protein (DUF455 family)
MTSAQPNELRQIALHAFLIEDPIEKCASVACMTPMLPVDPRVEMAGAESLPDVPGRPRAPVLVAPASLTNRSVNTLLGRAALLHALAHIEFNAINLALDAIWRFPGMPQDYYLDWLSVAREEAQHFGLLSERLKAIGYEYGDFPAHDGLWEMAQKTTGDALARLALVPRTLEARGLDVAPPVRHKLASASDPESAAVLDIILRDEIRHVAIGNRWYRHLCEQRGLDPIQAYDELALKYGAPKPRGPFNWSARKQAGFSDAELARLQKQTQRPATQTATDLGR